jgi:hypothetical protein
MSGPTYIPVLGTITAEDDDALVNPKITVITPSGVVVIISKADIHVLQAVQAGSGAVQGLSRIFVHPQSTLSIQLSAQAWMELDQYFDDARAPLARSGARKRIEDTA